MARKSRDIARFREALRSLGERIKERRKELKWNRDKLAEMSAVAPNTIAQIERGDVSCQIETLFQIASALQVDTSALLQGLDDLVKPAQLEAPSRFTH